MEDWIKANQSLASPNNAIYFPSPQMNDPKTPGKQRTVAPSGNIAGLITTADQAVGVWKAPAGVSASLKNVAGLEYKLSQAELEKLNNAGVNCLMDMPSYGLISFGARTSESYGNPSSDWKYIPIRRLALYIEMSLNSSMTWIAFRSNDENLWADIRKMTASFLQGLYVQGAFMGATSEEAFFVTCDRTTMSQEDITAGRVRMNVGFAPTYPAEFINLAMVFETPS